MEPSPNLKAKRKAVQEKREELQSQLRRLKEQQKTVDENLDIAREGTLESNHLILVDPQGTCHLSSETTAAALPVSLPSAKFEVGDHIWKWCHLPGVQEAYQHHAIVLDLWIDNSNDANRQWIMKVADFSLWAQRQQPSAGRMLIRLSSLWGTPSPASGNEEDTTVEYGLRTYDIPANDPAWSKVEYDTVYDHDHGAEEGTVDDGGVRSTVAACDDIPLVLQRVMFLLSFPELVPSYDLLENNCETVAVWCKTGTLASLQVMSGLTQFADQHQQFLWNVAQQSMGGLWSAVPSAAASNATATSFGSSISASTSSLWALYGLTAVVMPKVLLWHTQRKWQALTEDLNTVFWDLSTDAAADSDDEAGHDGSKDNHMGLLEEEEMPDISSIRINHIEIALGS